MGSFGSDSAAPAMTFEVKIFNSAMKMKEVAGLIHGRNAQHFNTREHVNNEILRTQLHILFTLPISAFPNTGLTNISWLSVSIVPRPIKPRKLPTPKLFKGNNLILLLHCKTDII